MTTIWFVLFLVAPPIQVLFWQLRHGLAFPSRGAALSLRRPITAVDASAVNASASGEGRKGLRGLQVTAVAGAVHGGTCVAFTGGGRGSGVGGGGGGGGGAAAALATAVMVVGSEAGAVLSFPPPAPLAAVPTTSSPEGPRWDTDARRILGAVSDLVGWKPSLWCPMDFKTPLHQPQAAP